MKRAAIIFLAGLLLAVAGYCAFYFRGIAGHRDLLEGGAPELLWLKQEFNLADAEFERLSVLHDNYLPECKEMARRIDETNAALRQLLASRADVTPEIEKTLAEAAELRAHCQKLMLKHFYEVARTMPPEQASRYLEWVQERTLFQPHGMCAHSPK